MSGRPTVLSLVALLTLSSLAVSQPSRAQERHTLSATSDRFEVVVKNDPIAPGDSARLDVFLSDYETNAPVGNALLELSLRSGAREFWTGRAGATSRPGIYTARLAAPQESGTFNLLITVRDGDVEERFALSGLEVGNAPAVPSRGGPGRVPWILGLAAAAGLGLLLMLLLGWRARRRHPARLAVLIGPLLALSAAPAGAHEGHTEAPTTTGGVAAAGATVFMPKESQFLLGVRTERARREWVREQLGVLGRVAPRGGVAIDVIAPQAGRVEFASGQAPVVGRRYRRGQAIGRLVIVDELTLRAPASGVVTGVFAFQGQLVGAGQKLLTLLDPSVVWVHADVYESDLERVQGSTRAWITSPNLPDLALPARRVAIGATLGEVPGAVEAWFEVPNPDEKLKIGALVDVGIEQAAAESTLVVPRTAVFQKDGRSLVFVKTAPERFAIREVRPTSNLGTRVAVEGDLEPGERVVTQGGYQLLSSPVAGAPR